MEQQTNQRACAYVAKLSSLYLAINGKDIVLDGDADENAKLVAEKIKDMRIEERYNTLMQGLLSRLREEVWIRMPNKLDYKTLYHKVKTRNQRRYDD